MVVWGEDHTIDSNLASNAIFSGGYNGRQETKNLDHEACFEFQDSGTITVTNNIVSIISWTLECLFRFYVRQLVVVSSIILSIRQPDMRESVSVFTVSRVSTQTSALQSGKTIAPTRAWLVSCHTHLTGSTALVTASLVRQQECTRWSICMVCCCFLRRRSRLDALTW